MISIKKRNKKEYKKLPNVKITRIYCLRPKQTNATSYSVRSSLRQLSGKEQNKLALNPFNDKFINLNTIQSLP